MRNWWVDEGFQAVEKASLYIFREHHNSRLSKRQAGKTIFEAGSFVARTWSGPQWGRKRGKEHVTLNLERPTSRPFFLAAVCLPTKSPFHPIINKLR